MSHRRFHRTSVLCLSTLSLVTAVLVGGSASAAETTVTPTAQAVGSESTSSHWLFVRVDVKGVPEGGRATLELRGSGLSGATRVNWTNNTLSDAPGGLWTPDNLTWQNKPDPAPTTSTQLAVGKPKNGKVQLDVTDLVNHAGTFSMVVRSDGAVKWITTGKAAPVVRIGNGRAPATNTPTVKPSTTTPPATKAPTPTTKASTTTKAPAITSTTKPSGGSPKPKPVGVSGSWALTFQDEFSGSSVDLSKWTPNWLGTNAETTKPINDAETTAYAPSQATVSGGALHLTAVKASTKTSNGQTYPYKSGIVQSSGKYEFTHGVIEARIYVPGSGGKIANWPAFWTDGHNWPADGEIDIFEGLGGEAAWHYHYNGGGPGGSVAGNFTGWHTYAAKWQAGSISFYYDGKLVGTQSTGVVDAKHFLILNNAIGEWGGPTSTPATMQVDYVRVWQ